MLVHGDGTKSLAPLVEHWHEDTEDAARPSVLLEATESGAVPFALANDQQGFFEVIAQEPDREKSFSHAMEASFCLCAEALVKDLPWSASSRVVDVGGSRGHLLFRVLEAYPKLRGLLLDLPSVVEGVEVDPTLRERTALVGIDLFGAHRSWPPAKDGDVWALRLVLHDFADDDAVQILQALSAHLAGTSAKLLVIEMVLAPEKAHTRLSLASLAASVDLLMHFFFGARERSFGQWARVLERGGFKVDRSIATRSPFTGLECSPTVTA
mmetsp:Transcript_26496/g.86879  ORF Transcript_26496/g.86879 Transcript_26496/m.86879 type:complete len:268 (+) Transcript_26496:193-996(+)